MTGSRGAHEESGHFRRWSVQASWLQLSCHARSCPAYRPMPAGPPVITRGNVKKEGTNPLSTPPLGRCGPRLPMQLFQVGFRGEVGGGGCRSAVITALVRETPQAHDRRQERLSTFWGELSSLSTQFWADPIAHHRALDVKIGAIKGSHCRVSFQSTHFETSMIALLGDWRRDHQRGL